MQVVLYDGRKPVVVVVVVVAVVVVVVVVELVITAERGPKPVIRRTNWKLTARGRPQCEIVTLLDYSSHDE